MKITIVCAGKIKEKYLTAGIAEFMKRLKPFAQVEIREIHEEKMPDSPSERAVISLCSMCSAKRSLLKSWRQRLTSWASPAAAISPFWLVVPLVFPKRYARLQMSF